MAKRLFQEWPLAAFTLAIQLACGIAIATTISARAQSSGSRALGISVFPIVVAALVLSLFHLGRPFSAWRALSNPLHSRLSLEILLTAAFALSAFAYSFTWLTAASTFRLYAGVTSSVLGIAAVIASAAIYQIPARPIWNSSWVVTSFIGSTSVISALVLWACSAHSRPSTIALLLGSTLLLLSGAWMWQRMSRPLEHASWFRIFFTAYLLFTVAPLLLLFSPVNSLTIDLTGTYCTAALSIITGRALMFALAEVEPRF